MSLPNGFLDELRARLSLGDVVGRKVMWDSRKSNPGKGDLWAPCPFHQEKTASFHVDDRKGFYYCFGCHAKGDAISFVRETENVGFMEAIEILAGEAGIPMPKQDPKAREKADRNSELAAAMEAAVRWLQLQLKTGQAAEARAYLERRGLTSEALAGYEIGFAPDSRNAMNQALTGQGIPMKDLIEAGLAAEPDGGGTPYDRFRGRIIFPIRDARGRCIGLGGRAMAADARAKYLNSPETPLFDKGRSLYNHGPARTAAGKGKPLIVAEGYMDVIALSEAGFEAAVAPLGTAVTEDQLRMLWRIADEPIIALDGDTAGLRAAMRLIDLALPLIEAGKSLRFAVMPAGKDPDDLIRDGGPAVMQAQLDKAQPMVNLLWQRETEGRVLDSPERRAALDKSLREALKKIADPSIRSHYGAAIKEMRQELFRPARQRGFAEGRTPFKRGWTPPAQPVPATKGSLLGGGSASEEVLREAVILATLITHPALIPDAMDALERLDFSSPDHAALAAALLQTRETEKNALLTWLVQKLGQSPLERLMATRHVQLSPPVRHPTDTDAARECLMIEIAKLQSNRGAAAEIAEAMAEIAGAEPPPDEAGQDGLTWRLGQAAQAKTDASRASEADSTEYDTGPNGAAIDKTERDALDALLEGIDFAKPPRASG